jgi:glycosyltransferase involved in cell wall biosynthesis
MLPPYTVIIPNFNHADFIKKRIDSILQQSQPPDEIIILDDASTDRSLEIIHNVHDERIRVYSNKQNSGSTFLQWKKGIELARNEIIWIAESDDYCAHNMAATILPWFSHTDVSFVFSDSVVIDEKDNIITPSVAKKETQFSIKMSTPLKLGGSEFVHNWMLSINAVPNASAVFFRKSLVSDITDEWLKYKVVGDWLFWIEMAQRGAVVFIPDGLNFFRKHMQTVRESKLRQFNKEKLLFYLYLSKRAEFQEERSFLKGRVFNYWWVFLHPKHGWFFNKEIMRLTPEILNNDYGLGLKMLNRLYEWLTFSKRRKHA